MTALICGSVAYDTIMVFPGKFKDHILAEKIHMLSVSFLVPQYSPSADSRSDRARRLYAASWRS